TGYAADQYWRYRMFYPTEKWIAAAAHSIVTTASPSFTKAVVRDLEVAAMLVSAHEAFEDPDRTDLERECRLIGAIRALLHRYSEAGNRPKRIAPGSVSIARDFLHAHFARKISLRELSKVSATSPFHLCRLFRQAYGLPPHAYQMQLRIDQAKSLLRDGNSPGETAMLCGFVDQSHLVRCFKRIFGVPPSVVSAAN
ncbi:MAG TPA: AraC family transcriptional regulator, partial [Chthoniobacterales bacterium]|nr:AraC family transcriptional regulator [Chthoniobacterales bacterium]